MQRTKKEFAHSICGVSGRMFHAHAWPDSITPERARGLLSTQTWGSFPRAIRRYGTGAKLTVELRFDDNCKNGHASFSITGEVRITKKQYVEACGCLHEDIAQVFPELAHLIPWHLTATDGPMHYEANTVYLAGNRDHWGLLKDEPHPGPRHQETRVYFGNSSISHKVNKEFAAWLQAAIAHRAATPATNPHRMEFEVVAVPHDNKPTGYQFGPKFTFSGFDVKWYECPFDTQRDAEEWRDALRQGTVIFRQFPTLFGEGKPRELDKARSVAVWPDATDAQLTLPPDELRALLRARLPGLLARFHGAMDSCGFAWNASELTE